MKTGLREPGRVTASTYFGIDNSDGIAERLHRPYTEHAVWLDLPRLGLQLGLVAGSCTLDASERI